MSGPFRSVVTVGTWSVALLLLVGVVTVGAASPGALDGQAAPTLTTFLTGVVAITAQAAVLAWALVRGRTSPVVALFAVCAIVPVAAAAGLGAAIGSTTVAALVAAYTVAVGTPWGRAVPALAVAGLLLALGEVVRAAGDEGLTAGSVALAVVQGTATVLLAAVVAAVVVARRDAVRARAEQLRAQAGEQAALTEAAVARQRTAMARELHDIAAHHLSGIAVMTAALDRQIDTDPTGAKVAVRQVRQQSTAMLRDLRNLVVLLRDDPTDGAVPVEPETLAGVPRLVRDARAAGREVELSVLGAEADGLADLDVGPLAQLAVHRTVQEALANAARHAPGAACEVVVDASGPAALVVAVRNTATAAPLAPPPGARGGLGIVGMRERAELTGSHLVTGPTPEGGFAVTLTVPRSAVEET
ncbi:histidine kinase [Microvirga sp. 0TCS3.31]